MSGSLVELAARVLRGEVTAESIAEKTSAAIAAHDGTVRAYLHTDSQDLLAQARAVDAKRARGETLGPLAGVPIGIKDALCTKGITTTCGSKMLEGYTPPYDATVVAKLREADALICGKTNLDEFCMGSSTENSAFFATTNPWDTERTPGGSSGGSAAAVAAGLAWGSLGSDTGGSIRQPASYTGCVGVKPTYGRVSRYGLVAFASSLDQVGPFARDVKSAAQILHVIAGADGFDATAAKEVVEDYVAACDNGVRGLRVGLPREYFPSTLRPDVNAAVRAAALTLEKAGATLVDVSLPNTDLAIAAYYVLANAEASSNLSRFDGVRFGHRTANASSLASLYADSRGEGFGAEVKRRILLGTFALSSGYYDAYYARARAAARLIRDGFAEVFTSVDVLLTPTAPEPAFRLGERTRDPISMYLADVFTLSANLGGVPALSVPAGLSTEGLPIGAQLLGPAFQEARLFAAAAVIEASAPLGGARPRVFAEDAS